MHQAISAYSLNVLKVCRGLSWHVDSWKLQVLYPFIELGAKINGATYCRDIILRQNHILTHIHCVPKKVTPKFKSL